MRLPAHARLHVRSDQVAAAHRAGRGQALAHAHPRHDISCTVDTAAGEPFARVDNAFWYIAGLALGFRRAPSLLGKRHEEGRVIGGKYVGGNLIPGAKGKIRADYQRVIDSAAASPTPHRLRDLCLGCCGVQGAKRSRGGVHGASVVLVL